MLRRNLCGLMVTAAMCSVAFAQHTPTATVDGQRVTIDADIAWWSWTQDLEGFSLVQGTPVVSPQIAVSSNGAAHIVWDVPPGTYAITAYGFPADRDNPVRQRADIEIVIAEPDRLTKIDDALRRFFFHRNEFRKAESDLEALSPTEAEYIGFFLGSE